MKPELIAGRYQVLRAIGRGGMGTVWLCRDEVLGREVAVKQIGALAGESATQTKRAMREARSAAALNHPNAVAVYDVVDHGGRPWLVMEYVEGQTLAEEIARAGRLPPQRVADIGAQLALALSRAHERHIVHRDIKPGNVLIDRGGRPKISDFGIARGQGDDQLTQIGFVTGTPGYLSPELARGGDPHPASDVWALGATLYSAVEGQSPYEPRSNPIALLRAIATEAPRPMRHAGVLAPAVEAMMDADPARRWDMATAAKRLGRIAAGHATVVMPLVDQAVDPGSAGPLAGRTQRLVERTRRLVAPAPPVQPTQRLPAAASPVQPTQRLPAAPPPVQLTKRVEATAPPVERTQHLAAPPVQPTQRLPDATPPSQPAKASPAGARVAKAPARAVEAVADAAGSVAVAAGTVAARAGDAKRAGPAEVARDVENRPGKPRQDDRTSVRQWLPLALVALLVATLGMTYLSRLAGQGGSSAARSTAGASTPAKPSGTTSQTPPATAAAVPKADKNIVSFVSSYYSHVTKDPNRTWGQLAPAMQNSAGGRRGYDSFWRTIDRVKVNQTRVDAAALTAVVNLTFTRKDGTRSTENHRFTFLNNGSGYLIQSDKFLG